ncbi:MAG: hypothetical protein HZA05_04850, partial [Nitrospirae bacterium]|nr:hypothetical protein [Nitrospirota bacterium]
MMTRKIAHALFLLVFCAFIFHELSGTVFAEEIKIKYIEVMGNKRVNTSTIRSKIKIKEGDVFSPEKLREDIKSIFQMGFFDDVKVETEGF